MSDDAAHLGEAYLRTERVGDAVAFATQALELSRQYKERGREAWSLRALGEVALAHERPDADRAEGAFRQASVLAGGLRRTRDGSRAKEHLALALGLLRDMTMEHWAARARTEIGASV